MRDIEYFHKNYLDHVYAVSDDNGNVVEHYRYTAFGKVEVFSATGLPLVVSAISNDILWNVKRYDGAAGTYLYHYRHYRPDLGRWISRDPIAERGGLNYYSFVGNCAVSIVDGLGLAPMGWPVLPPPGSPPSMPDRPPSSPKPSVFDQFGDGPLGNEKDYWENRFPGWVKEAKSGAAELADSSVYGECGGELSIVEVGYLKQMTPSSGASDTPGPITDFLSHIVGWNYGDDGTDDDYGDRPQDGWEANELYGTVTFQMDDVEITDGPTKERCCYSWTGTLRLVDDLGTSADDFENQAHGAGFAHHVMGARGGPGGGERMDRATWTITGTTCCED